MTLYHWVSTLVSSQQACLEASFVGEEEGLLGYTRRSVSGSVGGVRTVLLDRAASAALTPTPFSRQAADSSMLLHQRSLQRQLERQVHCACTTDGHRLHCSPRQQQQQQQQQQSHSTPVGASSLQERRRVSRRARPLGQVLEEAAHHPESLDAGEVAEAVTVSVKKTTRHLINSPTTACIALNLGAALFGSNQARCCCLLWCTREDKPACSSD